jgi:hypothetical protein
MEKDMAAGEGDESLEDLEEPAVATEGKKPEL